MVFVPVPAVNDRLLVSLTVSVVPAELYGTVMTTGDQFLPTAAVAAAGFAAAQVAPPVPASAHW